MKTFITTFGCWALGVLVWQLVMYGIKHPTTRLIPSPLRHTWFAGLGTIVGVFLFCLPLLLEGYGSVAFLFLLAFLALFWNKGPKLLIDDLRLHRIDGRSLFQHSKGCYMKRKDGIPTFVEKSLKKLDQ